MYMVTQQKELLEPQEIATNYLSFFWGFSVSSKILWRIIWILSGNYPNKKEVILIQASDEVDTATLLLWIDISLCSILMQFCFKPVSPQKNTIKEKVFFFILNKSSKNAERTKIKLIILLPTLAPLLQIVSLLPKL